MTHRRLGTRFALLSMCLAMVGCFVIFDGDAHSEIREPNLELARPSRGERLPSVVCPDVLSERPTILM
jgi:hypothetical protein